ncbi:MAG: exodeoxyribonuclease VII large subunit [Luteitalea sp.]|nr:exodeoxyribonuclease VII large subunit [Luteitalea sp.]
MTTLFDLPFEDEPPEPPAPRSDRGPTRRVLSVRALTQQIRARLEGGFPDVWVEGELSNCRLWTTGILYFTLKDDGAQVRAVMFRAAVGFLRFKPRDGMHVLVRAAVGVYEPRGEYQLVVEEMEPKGVGALQLAFEQLKKTLQAEGIFDASRKRPLPMLPQKIGIVTSLDGAALRDILKVLRQRHASVHVVIRPARVQGAGAAEDITRGLRQLTRVDGVDAIIVGRGGGSIEDLWAFNEEAVARAIAACPVPVISGVGHQVDYTIADFVADVRAATPSNAAEIVVARKEEFCGRIDRLVERLRARLVQGLGVRHRILHDVATRRGFSRVRMRLASSDRRAGELTHDLRHVIRAALSRRRDTLHAQRLRLEAQDLRRRLPDARRQLHVAETKLRAAVDRGHQHVDSRLRTLVGQLDTLSPLSVLARGFALCWNADRSVLLRDARGVASGDEVHVQLQRGELTCTVDLVRRNEHS